MVKELEIYLYGEIGEDVSIPEVRGTLNYLRNNYELDRLKVRILSYGGSVQESYGIVDAFNEYSKQTGTERVFINDCYSASAAMNIMLDASDRILGTPHSKFLVHRAWAIVAGNSKDLKGYIEQLEEATEPHILSLMKRLNKTREEVEVLLDEERWYTAQEAQEIGLIDGIYDGTMNEDLAQALNQKVESRGITQIKGMEGITQAVRDEVKRQHILSTLL